MQAKNEELARVGSLKLSKSRGSIHPQAVANYIPKERIVIPKPNNAEAYGSLTDSSSYAEYAWAFLRRNRFYQSMIDRAKPTFDIETWGYKWNSKASATFGLVKAKKYHEPFHSGTKVEWLGIHDFYLDTIHKRLAGATVHNQVEFPQAQIAFVFDVGPSLGPRTPAFDTQLGIAKWWLSKLAEENDFSTGKRKVAPSKKALRAQLRIADLMSCPSGVTVNSLAKENIKPNAQRRTPRVTPSERAKLLKDLDGLSITNVAQLIPEFDLGRNDSPVNLKQQLGRASELVVDAWESIYQWEFLTWLHFDDWANDLAKHYKEQQETSKGH